MIGFSDTSHPCPATTKGKPCGQRLSSEMLLCRRHWKRLPQGLQRQVNVAWRTLQATVDGPEFDPEWDGAGEAYRRYMVIRKRAVDEVST